MDTAKRKSLYTYSAEYGLMFGLYLSVIALCFMLSVRFISTSLIVYPLLIGAPLIIWIDMIRLYRQEPAYRTNGALWMFGICLAFFGSLICATTTVGYMYFIEPDFFYKYAKMLIDIINESAMSAQYKEQTEILQLAIDKRELPSPFDFAISMSWFTLFMGSITAMFFAPIIRYVGAKKYNIKPI